MKGYGWCSSEGRRAGRRRSEVVGGEAGDSSFVPCVISAPLASNGVLISPRGLHYMITNSASSITQGPGVLLKCNATGAPCSLLEETLGPTVSSLA